MEYDSVRDTDPEIGTVTNQNDGLLSVKPLTPKAMLKRNSSSEHDHRNYSLYDYNELVDEYYEEASLETKSNATYHPSEGSKSRTDILRSLKKLMTFEMRAKNCTAEELSQIGFKAIYCLYTDFRQGRRDPRVLAGRLFQIVRIWLYIYLVVAIAFWCTKGWCCCCLFCKFFKPRQTIEEAKHYLANNPPGVILTAQGQTVYEPTEREIERYEEFEHFILTV